MKNRFANWPQDIRAGFIIFLIALPLSVGIAMASGAPASAGLLSAMVGGILGSWLGGSELTINGPAAGLIVVVLSAIESLGAGDLTLGFQCALAATLTAGAIQILLGRLKLANIGLAFPSSVIHGMLSAIGAIIIAKQIPALLGVKPQTKEILGLYLEIPQHIKNLNPEVAFIGFTSLFVLVGGNWSFPRLAKKIPLPIVAVMAGIALAKFFDLEHEHRVHFLNWDGLVSAKLLLSVPDHIQDSIIYPNFEKYWTFQNFIAVVTIVLIASIESVLSTFAVDKLDPEKRESDLNRDLMSKGLCNFVLGWIGGLPIISEIVRSSANISNGAQSRLANFFHGFFILGFLVAFPELLKLIPLSGLAGILIFVGWRLAHPSQFLHAYHVGKEHIFCFLITFWMTLATDLLIGVAAGVLAEFAIALFQNVNVKNWFHVEFKTEQELQNDLIRTRLRVLSPLIFCNSLMLRRKILELKVNQGPIILDLRDCHFIDHTVMDQLDRFGDSIQVEYCQNHKKWSNHPLSARRKEVA